MLSDADLKESGRFLGRGAFGEVREALTVVMTENYTSFHDFPQRTAQIQA